MLKDTPLDKILTFGQVENESTPCKIYTSRLTISTQRKMHIYIYIIIYINMCVCLNINKGYLWIKMHNPRNPNKFLISYMFSSTQHEFLSSFLQPPKPTPPWRQNDSEFRSGFSVAGEAISWELEPAGTWFPPPGFWSFWTGDFRNFPGCGCSEMWLPGFQRNGCKHMLHPWFLVVEESGI